MSRSVTFNGITQYRPGGLSKINANALAQIGLSPNGIIGLIGESEGGVPNVVTRIDDPALATSAFRSGPLADAIRVAFDPSSDPRVPAGAFRVLAVRVNQGTQSTLTLYTVVPTTVGGLIYDTVTSFGGGGTIVTLTTGGLVASAHIGNYLRIGTEERLITANDGGGAGVGTVTVNAAFGAWPAGTPVYFLAPQFTYTSKDYGLHTNRIRQEVESGVSAGVAWTTELDADNQVSEDVGGKGYIDLEYIGQNVQVTQDSGTSSADANTKHLADTTKNWVINAFTGYYAYVGIGGGLNVANIRKIASNTSGLGTSVITTTEDFTNIAGVATAPGASSPYSVRTGAILSGTLAAGSTSTTANLAASISVAVNELAGLVIAITGGVGAGQRRVIASNTAGVSGVITVVQPWNTTPDATSTYTIRYITKATATITGAAGVSTTLTSSVAVNGVAAAGDLNITFTTGQTIQDLVSLINTNANYMAYVSTGRNPLDLINNFDIDSGSYEVEIRTDRSQAAAPPFPVFNYAAVTGTGTSVTLGGNGIATFNHAGGAFTQAMVGQRLILAAAGGWAAGNRGQWEIVGVKSTTALHFKCATAVAEVVAGAYSIVGPVSMKWNNHFRKDLAALLSDITAINQYVTVARAAGASFGAGTGLPEFTGSGLGSKAVVGDYYKSMAGGTRGISTNTNWQNAFDLLLRVRKTSVVPCMSEDQATLGYSSTATLASVAAQLAAHVALCRGVEKNECGGYLGMKGTKTAYISQLNALNDTDVAVTSQYFTFLDAAGTLKRMDPWASAVAAAGMRAGMPEVGEPLTHKYIKTSDLYQDVSWDPAARTDANLLIQNGGLFAEYIQGKGIRWVRDLTSYIQDDNLAYSEGSVRDVARYVSYGLRTFLEDRFTGIKAHPANASNIKESAASYLELCRGDNIIVDSTDDKGNVIHAYHNLRVTISGDIARIRVECFPVVGINFQLTDIYLQLPTQSA